MVQDSGLEGLTVSMTFSSMKIENTKSFQQPPFQFGA